MSSNLQEEPWALMAKMGLRIHSVENLTAWVRLYNLIILEAPSVVEELMEPPA